MWIKHFWYWEEGKGGVAQGRSWSCTELKVLHTSSICLFYSWAQNLKCSHFSSSSTDRGHSPDLFLIIDSRVSAYKPTPNCLTSCSLLRRLDSNRSVQISLSPIFYICLAFLQAFAHTVCLPSIPSDLRTSELTLVKDLLKWSFFKTTGCQVQ